MDKSEIALPALPLHQPARVTRLTTKGAMRRRLLDLGLTPGAAAAGTPVSTLIGCMSDGLLAHVTYVDAQGKVLGTHEGYVNYTIGQRKGLGIALGHPAYITHIDAKTNRITLGTNDDMLATELRFKPSSLRHDVMLSSSLTAKVRYRSTPVPVKKIDGNRISFATPVWGITPGQSVVIYSDDLVVGGGIILGS